MLLLLWLTMDDLVLSEMSKTVEPRELDIIITDILTTGEMKETVW